MIRVSFWLGRGIYNLADIDWAGDPDPRGWAKHVLLSESFDEFLVATREIVSDANASNPPTAWPLGWSDGNLWWYAYAWYAGDVWMSSYEDSGWKLARTLDRKAVVGD